MKLDFNEKWIYYKDKTDGVSVNLPHDAMIDGKRSKTSPGGAACAYFEGGVYRYTKQFSVPEEWKDKNVYFKFGGVYRKAKIYINSIPVFEWANGYTDFSFCVDGYINYGKNNEIEVIADNSEQPNSRWYTGGGIYRPVTLIVKDKTHFELNGITVKTVSVNPAVIEITAKHTGGEVTYEIYDGDKKIAQTSETKIQIENAKLWSDKSPNLYTLKAVLKENGKTVDEEEVVFGIREVKATTKGLFVNGERVLLRGGCVHHDNGILGARCFAEAEERKVRIIKDAGYNAIRSSHNPCSEAFVSACDKYGIYLIDEFSDMWYMRKKKFDYALDFEKWYKKDLAAMVDKDKNHPSVIMYSIANEISEPFEQRGVDTAKQMVEYMHALDGTRFVTAGINLFIINNAKKGKGQYSEEKVEADALPKAQSEKPTSSTLFNMIATRVGPSMNKMANSDEVDKVTSPLLDSLDIAGYNYASGRYPLEGEKHPNRIIYGSETFPQDIYKNWQAVQKYTYILGDFMWTAIDYLGEVGIGGWSYDKQYGITFEKPYPWLIADAGAIDLIGTVGAEAKYAATVWGLNSKPVICVRPVNHAKDKVVKSVWRGTDAIESWSWYGCEKNKAEIEVYSDAAFIKLELNGKVLATKSVKECKAKFKTKYRHGKLVAVALNKNKKEISRSELVSAEKDHKIFLKAEKDCVGVGDILFINVNIADKNGITECNADTELLIETDGELLAFGSAQQKSEEKYSSNKTRTYYGRALAVIKATKKGLLNVNVTGDGKKSSIAINVN